MARRRPPRPVPRVALTLTEAADSLGMSVDHFNRHVRPELRSVQRGTLRLWPVDELQKWAESAAELEQRRCA